jgi:hypothetical protein
MRPEEALCLALALISESQKHGHDTLRRVEFIRKKLNKAAQQEPKP